LKEKQEEIQDLKKEKQEKILRMTIRIYEQIS